MSFHANTPIEGVYEYRLLSNPYGVFQVAIVNEEGILCGTIGRRSSRRIKVVLVRSYTPEYLPGKKVHSLTLHSSIAAARARASESPSSSHTFINVHPEGGTQ